MRVSYNAARNALERLDGKIPDNPKVTVELGNVSADGSCELTISGSPHASVENVVRKMGLTPLEAKPITSIRRPPASQAFVDSRPAAKNPDPAIRRAAATRREKRSGRPPKKK